MIILQQKKRNLLAYKLVLTRRQQTRHLAQQVQIQCRIRWYLPNSTRRQTKLRIRGYLPMIILMQKRTLLQQYPAKQVRSMLTRIFCNQQNREHHSLHLAFQIVILLIKPSAAASRFLEVNLASDLSPFSQSPSRQRRTYHY